MLYKPNWEKTQKRLAALWENEIEDRCMAAIFAPLEKGMRGVDCFTPDDVNENDYNDLRDYYENPERILKRNVARFERSYKESDALPAIFFNFGTSGHCNYFGCKPIYKKDTIWFDHVLEGELDASQLQFRVEGELEKELKVFDYLVKESKGKFFLGMPDNCGTLDAFGTLRGTGNVMIDLILSPEEVKKASRIIDEGWKKANQMFYDRIFETNEGGCVHSWMNLWAKGKIMQMQCDMSVMISPDMYKEFVMPELEFQCEYLDYPVYHFDGIEQTAHLDHILSIDKIKMIQWTHVAGQLSPKHYLDTLRRMQKAGKGIVLYTPKEDIPEIMAGLSSKGLFIHTYADDQYEADQILKYIEKHTKE